MIPWVLLESRVVSKQTQALLTKIYTARVNNPRPKVLAKFKQKREYFWEASLA